MASYLERQLSLSEGGGVYFEGARISPVKGKAILFVGLGGTGADALLRIKNQIKSRMILPRDDKGVITADVPSNIAFLAIDSDGDTERKTYGQVGFNEYGEDFQSIAVDDLPSVIASIHTGSDTVIKSWFDKGINAVAGKNGAGGIRQIGRLLLFKNISEVVGKIKNRIDDISDGTNGLWIFLVTGIAGGTGSGTFLDMAYLLRHVAKNVAFVANTQLFGYIVTPDVNERNGGDRDMLYSNGFACLKELDYWMSSDEHGKAFVQQYSPTLTVNMLAQPYDFCHIITAQDFKGNGISYNGALDAIAENIFAYVADDMGTDAGGNTTFDSMYSNIMRQMAVAGANGPFPGCYYYLSIGASMRRIPYGEIATLFAARTFAKLRGPIINRMPTSQEYLADEKSFGLDDTALRSFIMKGVVRNPVEDRDFKWQDIWGTQNIPLELQEKWLAHSQPTIKRQMANLPADKEGTFKEFFAKYVKDNTRGPCYVTRLLYSESNHCLIKVMEKLKLHYKELSEQCVAQSGDLKQAVDADFTAGRKVGVFGKKAATEQYLKSLKAYGENEMLWFQYRDLTAALGKLIERMQVYYDKLFGPLRDILQLLDKIFQENLNKLIAQEQHAADNQDNSILIRPLVFEEAHQTEVDAAVLSAAKGFAANLGQELIRWIGLDLNTLDSKVARRTNIGGSIAEYIEKHFEKLTSVSVEALLQEKLVPGETLDDVAKAMFVNLKNSAIPMFLPVPLHNNVGKRFFFASVPRNCANILAAKSSISKAVGGNPSFKDSAEKDKAYWVEVIACLPLFAFAKLETMEETYQRMMSDAKTRIGVHLQYDWYEKMPSPLPECAYQGAYRCESTVARNRRNRENYDICYREGALVYDAVKQCMVLNSAAAAPDLTSVYGTLEGRLNQINLIRDACWGDASVKTELPKLGTLYITEPITEAGVAANVRENVLRFHNICESLAEQAELLKVVNAERKKLEAVKYYVYACIADLFFSAGRTEIKLRRSPDDYAPVFIYDKNAGKTHRDYWMYKSFLDIIDESWKENLDNQLRRVYEECDASQEMHDGVVERLNARVEKYNAELKLVSRERSRARADMVEELIAMEQFYNDCIEVCEAQKEILTPAEDELF